MKKIISLLLLLLSLFGFIFPGSTYAEIMIETKVETNYPSGDKFIKLRSITENYLIDQNNSYGYKYKGNIMYNEIIEKEIKAIVIETYSGNEEFYKSYFSNYSNSSTTLKDILNYIPKVTSSYNIKDVLFNNNTAGDRLMNASFGIDYTPTTYDSQMYSLKSIIEVYKSRNGYYPPLEELNDQTIYNNGQNVLVSEVMDEYIYKIEYKGSALFENNQDVINNRISEIYPDISNNDNSQVTSIRDEAFVEKVKIDLLKIQKGGKEANLILTEYNKIYNSLQRNDIYYNDKRAVIQQIIYLVTDLYNKNSTYTLVRKNNIYSYSEALEKNEEVLEILSQKNSKDSEVVYKDYKTLIGDSEITNVPELYKKIPNDSIFLHVKNPEFIFDLVNRDNTLLNSTTGIGAMKKLKSLSQDWFDIEDFDTIEKNLKHEFIVVISDLDLTNPDVTIIIHKDDKAILVPTDTAKVAVTKGDYIYIASSKKSLEKFNELKEEDSIYNSLDFKYLWLQKGSNFKDVFFFAGDKFFEKMITFDNYIKMTRKIHDYVDLKDLQTYVFAYKKLNGKDVEFSDLDNFFEITQIDKDDIMENFEISSDSIVKHKLIGTVDNIKSLPEIDYDLSKISSNELRGYQQSILKYKEIWRANLDPMGIFINSVDDGFSIDFFMTPLPEINDGDLAIFKTLFGAGVQNFDFLNNPNLRIGALGGMVGFDVDELKNRLDNAEDEENRDLYYLKRGIDEFNDELLDGGDIFDYLGGEFMLSFGGLDPSILNGRDADKLDAFFAVEFKSKLKAKELISIVRKKIVSEMGGSRMMNDTLSSALLKPITEDYNGNTIYTIPLRDFYFPITFYYTLVDNYLYITLSEGSIKSIIDYSVEGSTDKEKFQDKSLENEKILYGFMDATKMAPMINEIRSGTGVAIEDIYVEMMTNRDLENISPVNLELGKYYNDREYSQLLGKDNIEYENDLGFMNIYTKDSDLYIKIDKELAKTSSDDVNDEIESVFAEIDEVYFLEQGGKLDELLTNGDSFEKLLKIDLFNKVLNTDFLDKLLLNTSISFNIGDNIVEFKYVAFGENFGDSIGKVGDNLFEKMSTIFPFKNEDGDNNSLIYIIILSLLVLLGGAVIFKMKKASIKTTSLITEVGTILQDESVITQKENTISQDIKTVSPEESILSQEAETLIREAKILDIDKTSDNNKIFMDMDNLEEITKEKTEEPTKNNILK